MKTNLVCALIPGLVFVLSAQTTPPAPATDAAYVLTVGEEHLTKAQFEALVGTLPDNLRARAATPEGKRALAEDLAQLMSLAQEARRLKIDQEPGTQQEVRLQTDQILASAAVGRLVEMNPVSEADLKKYYDEHATEYQEVDVRHILVRFKGSAVPLRPNQPELTEEEALARANLLYAKIEAGGDFAELAKTESDDTATGARGGDVGKFARGSMIPEFEQVAFGLKKGEVSKPFRTDYGYHIVQLIEREDRTLEDARDEIEAKLKPEHAREIAAGVRQKANVVFSEEYFGKAPAPAN